MSGEHTWLLCDIEAEDPAVARLWAKVRVNAQLPELLHELWSGSPPAANVALLSLDGIRLRVVVRGAAVVRLSTGGADATIATTGQLTWREEAFALPDRAEMLLDGGVLRGTLPLASGVSMATSLSLDWTPKTPPALAPMVAAPPVPQRAVETPPAPPLLVDSLDGIGESSSYDHIFERTTHPDSVFVDSPPPAVIDAGAIETASFVGTMPPPMLD
jgi:hypothetical protein